MAKLFCHLLVCSNWTSTHEVFRNSSGHCFQLYSRDCVYRGCSFLNATERKLGSVPCPLKQISSISSTTGKASTVACNSTAPITVTRVSVSERVVVSTRFIAIKPTITTSQRNTLYTQLPCTRVVVPIPTPTTKGRVSGTLWLTALSGTWPNYGVCSLFINFFLKSLLSEA